MAAAELRAISVTPPPGLVILSDRRDEKIIAFSDPEQAETFAAAVTRWSGLEFAIVVPYTPQPGDDFKLIDVDGDALEFFNAFCKDVRRLTTIRNYIASMN